MILRISSTTLMTWRRYFLVKILHCFSQFAFFFILSYFRETIIGRSPVKQMFLWHEEIIREKNWKSCLFLAGCKMLNQCFVLYPNSFNINCNIHFNIIVYIFAKAHLFPILFTILALSDLTTFRCQVSSKHWVQKIRRINHFHC